MARYHSPGERLDAWLRQSAMTQTLLARESGLSRRHVYKILRDDTRITGAVAEKLERVTGVARREWLRLSSVESLRRQEEGRGDGGAERVRG